MIQIDKIDERGYGYKFPTIDFKFQNTGDATAFLWKFAISVINAEIDPKPKLEFRAKVTEDALEVDVINNGWGAALDCHIQIDESTLNKFFDQATRQLQGTIQSGESRQCLRLTHNMADVSQFEALSKKSVALNTEDEIELGLISATWVCIDEKGNRHEENQPVWIADENTAIALTPNGFVSYWQVSILYQYEASYITYITIIDPSKNSHERTYPISHKIPSGDVERFHIMIGASASCRLRVKFRFFVDEENVIESEEFDINIWNPKNSGWHNDYADGTEFYREVNASLGSPKTEGIEEQGRQISRRTGRVDHNYPFTRPKGY